MVHQNRLEKYNKSIGSNQNRLEAASEKPKLKVLLILQLKMIEVRLSFTFSRLVIIQQLPRFLIQPLQKQFRQMELIMDISFNNHLQGSQYSMFRYIIMLHNNKCPITSFLNGSTVPPFPSFICVMEGSRILQQHH